jgi:hypothetical protein
MQSKENNLRKVKAKRLKLKDQAESLSFALQFNNTPAYINLCVLYGQKIRL